MKFEMHKRLFALFGAVYCPKCGSRGPHAVIKSRSYPGEEILLRDRRTDITLGSLQRAVYDTEYKCDRCGATWTHHDSGPV
jgi:ribosomal protein L44E